ncbi:hypothetical protein CB1_000966003 [Camelus ferus]|nr:hypothetical protein CB1_000966003 [Camelus ferus]
MILFSFYPTLCTASSIRAQTLEREVPSSADSRGSADSTIVHSTSDPIMTARGMRPLQSLLPKPASSGKISSQMQNEAEPRPQTCSSFDYTENTMASEPLPAWGGDSAAAQTQDKVPRMCAYSASGGSDSDSDLDYGSNGFGAGRGKLVKARKSATPVPGGSYQLVSLPDASHTCPFWGPSTAAPVAPAPGLQSPTASLCPFPPPALARLIPLKHIDPAVTKV